ncbi:MAG: group II truncated hemoglobin [Burkholderiaceae bacterium]|nr:group II truncated hemoglobin [Burkholderiaceae bacterium]
MDPKPTVLESDRHYVRLGGREAVVRLVDAFYRAMDTRPEAATIRAMHEPDLDQTRAVLVKYLTEWMGGDKLYSPVHGAPMLRRRHQRFAIDAAARDAWMLCMREALNEVCADAGLRSELDAAFYKVADFMRNADSDSSPSHP